MSRDFKVGDRVKFASTGDFEHGVSDVGEVVEVLEGGNVRVKWDSDGDVTVPTTNRIRLIEDVPNKHVHHDVIIQWAKGYPIQYRNYLMPYWSDIAGTPEWRATTEYRVKPKKVKKTGWINIYPTWDAQYPEAIANSGCVYPTKEDADNRTQSNRIACVEIEWEEEA